MLELIRNNIIQEILIIFMIIIKKKVNILFYFISILFIILNFITRWNYSYIFLISYLADKQSRWLASPFVFRIALLIIDTLKIFIRHQEFLFFVGSSNTNRLTAALRFFYKRSLLLSWVETRFNTINSVVIYPIGFSTDNKCIHIFGAKKFYTHITEEWLGL